MSRYQLSSAEQLRRQLARISKHQDQAAVQVQRKLRSMQENIAPFLEEPRPVLETGSSPTPAPKNMSAWAFASRVPTGRLPDTSIPDRPGAVYAVREEERIVGTPLCVARPAVSAGTRRGPMPESATLRDDDLDEALESEIDNFFADADDGSARSSGSRPQYRVLRAKTSHGTQAARTPLPATVRSPCSSPGTSGADAELGEIEEEAGALEAQLAWWRGHKAVLTREPWSQLDGEPAEPPACDEIAGHSEFLRLSSSQLAQMEEPLLDDAAAPSLMPDLPLFGPQSRAAKATQLDATKAFGTIDARDASMRTLDFGDSLSEVVRRQADDLITSVMASAENREVTFGRHDASGLAPTLGLGGCDEEAPWPREVTQPTPLRSIDLEWPTAAPNAPSASAAFPSEPASPAPAPRIQSGQTGLGSLQGSPTVIAHRTPKVVVSRSCPDTPPKVAWQRVAGSPSCDPRATVSQREAEQDARGPSLSIRSTAGAQPAHPNAERASEAATPPAEFTPHLLDGRGSSLPQVYWQAELSADDAQPTRSEFARRYVPRSEDVSSAVLDQGDGMLARERVSDSAKATLELAREWAAEFEGSATKSAWAVPAGAASASVRAADVQAGAMHEHFQFTDDGSHCTSKQFIDSTVPTRGVRKVATQGGPPSFEVGSFGASLQAPKLEIRSFDELFNM